MGQSGNFTLSHLRICCHLAARGRRNADLKLYSPTESLLGFPFSLIQRHWEPRLIALYKYTQGYKSSDRADIAVITIVKVSFFWQFIALCLFAQAYKPLESVSPHLLKRISERTLCWGRSFISALLTLWLLNNNSFWHGTKCNVQFICWRKEKLLVRLLR